MRSSGTHPSPRRPASPWSKSSTRRTRAKSGGCISWAKIRPCRTPISTTPGPELAKLEHLVVQDIFLTETAMLADVVLPSSAWPEKSGTVTNTNRQVQMGRKALDLPGDTREDLWITVELAKRLGLKWNYKHPSEVFAEMKLAMPSLDNITWERLEQESSIMYPCPAPDHPGEAIVFGDGFPTKTGRATRPGRCVAPCRSAGRGISIGADNRASA